MTNNLYFKRYADLLLSTGVNIQKDQPLVITAPIEGVNFVHLVAEMAYDKGASDVAVNWRDDYTTRLVYLKGKDSLFDTYPLWQKEFYNSYLHQDAAFLTFIATDPTLLSNAKVDRILRSQKISGSALKEYQDNLMGSYNSWCMAPIAINSWAQKVFSSLQKDEACMKLWSLIFKAAKVEDCNYELVWEQHKANLLNTCTILNKLELRELRLENSLGTDLSIKLPQEHTWKTVINKNNKGIEFVANIPTEEVFTLPDKYGVDGRVISSKPLVFAGNVIDNFSMEFEAGKVINVHAKTGGELLEQLIGVDEGASFLGEIAFVPYNSTIAQMNTIFYHVLFDENAACHLALGKAYPESIINGRCLSEKEFQKLGGNISFLHQDFMFGTHDLSIKGYKSNNMIIDIFKDGNYIL